MVDLKEMNERSSAVSDAAVLQRAAMGQEKLNQDNENAGLFLIC